MARRRAEHEASGAAVDVEDEWRVSATPSAKLDVALSKLAVIVQTPNFWAGAVAGTAAGTLLAVLFLHVSMSNAPASCPACPACASFVGTELSTASAGPGITSAAITSPASDHSQPSDGSALLAVPLTATPGEPTNLRASHRQAKPNLRALPADGLARRPAVMRELIEQVRKHAGDDVRERCLAVVEGKPGSLFKGWSQAGQDWLLFHNFYWDIPYGQGKYIDIGSNHPRKLSNTYFFDRCLGWRGVCVEPNPDYYFQYGEHNRTCKLLRNCLNDHEGTMFFLRDGVMGQLFDSMPVGAKADKVIEVQCRRLPDVLVEHDLADADLASIDIEGAEVPTLRCFPFHAFHISTWVAEIDKSPDLEKLFLRAGYAHVMDVLCPVGAVLSNVTRVGWELDSIFRLQPALALGPPFLPGGPLFQSGPKGACTPAEVQVGVCAEQVPIIDRLEANWETDWKLTKGVCRIPYPQGSGLSTIEFVHYLANHPAPLKPAGEIGKNTNL